NYSDVAVVISPTQYAFVLEEMRRNNGGLSLEMRECLAAAAFAHTAAYDRAISAYFASRSLPSPPGGGRGVGGEGGEETFPTSLDLHLERRQSLRYGENPHQHAAFYVEPDAPPGRVANAEVLHGKELSYNNLLDLESALNLVREFAEPAAVVVKHNNPCGA